jgi:hypothetical protein
MTAAPMPTPSAAFVYVVAAVILIALAGGCVYAIGWAWRGFNRDTDRDIDQAVALVCQPCNGYSRTAPCTCPGKCTAAVCMAPAVRRG